MTLDDPPPLAKLRRYISDAMEWLLKALSFLTTLRAVASGTEVWKLNAAELNAGHLLGPWATAAFKAALLVTASSAVTSAFNLLLPVVNDSTALAEVKSSELDAMFAKVAPSMSGLATSLFFTALAFLVGWGSLRSKHTSGPARMQARYAYLYLDSLYGFLPQLLLCTLPIVLSHSKKVDPLSYLSPFWPLLNLRFDTVAQMWVFLLISLAVLVQAYVLLSRIPRKLFIANGYSNRFRWFLRPSLPLDPPWGKYFASLAIATYPVQIAIILLGALWSYALAWLALSLRSLVA
jgi:hypothetical protein